MEGVVRAHQRDVPHCPELFVGNIFEVAPALQPGHCETQLCLDQPVEPAQRGVAAEERKEPARPGEVRRLSADAEQAPIEPADSTERWVLAAARPPGDTPRSAA